MLMSMTAAPAASAMLRAFRHPAWLAAGKLHHVNADPVVLGTQPRIGAALGQRPARVISDTTRPAPRRATRRRNGASVMPDIGARMTLFGNATLPMAILEDRNTVAVIVTYRPCTEIRRNISDAYSLANSSRRASAALQKDRVVIKSQRAPSTEICPNSRRRAKPTRHRHYLDPYTMPPMVAAVVVAAGRGLRAGGDLPKQYRQFWASR